MRKATSVPAREMLGLTDRGVIAEGAYADLVVFDYENLRGNDDYQHVTRPPEGIAACDRQRQSGLREQDSTPAYAPARCCATVKE